MKYGKARFIWVMLALAFFFAIFFTRSQEWITLRKIALAPHISTSGTHLFPKTIVAAAILLFTAFLGRWYCSLLCPSGLLQDFFTQVGTKLKICRLGFKKTIPHYGQAIVLFLIILFAFFGAIEPALRTDPIANFGGTAIVAGDALRNLTIGGWRLWDTWHYTLVALPLLLLVILPLLFGRVFCNYLCPVGGLLYLFGKLPGKRLRIASDNCASCGQCAKLCPAQCLDSDNKTLDAARCLMCLRCTTACRKDAITYTRQPRQYPGQRRKFLDATVASLASLAYFSSRDLGGILTRPKKETQIAPPGSTGDTNHRIHCIACQACVRACPVYIIHPDASMRPTLDFTHGYCQYNCVECSRSCPAGVFKPLALEEKHILRIAATKLNLNYCVVTTLHHECGACAEVCPTHAVSMISQGEGEPTLPSFDADYCIGCGACYHVCPAYPRAFSVTGLAQHETTQGIRIIGPHDGQNHDVNQFGEETDALTDFPF